MYSTGECTKDAQVDAREEKVQTHLCAIHPDIPTPISNTKKDLLTSSPHSFLVEHCTLACLFDLTFPLYTQTDSH